MNTALANGDLNLERRGETDAAICAEIERHMQTCANCRAVVNTLDKTITLYQTLPAPEVPSGIEEQLLRL